MYKKAAQGYLEVKTTTKVRADEEDSYPDFSTEAGGGSSARQRSALV